MAAIYGLPLTKDVARVLNTHRVFEGVSFAPGVTQQSFNVVRAQAVIAAALLNQGGKFS